MKILLSSAFLMALAVGCAMPRTGTQVVDGRSRMIVKDAPKEALLYVDGVVMGQAGSFDGDPSVLLLEPGTHLVEVKAGDRLLFSQRVFLGGGELRTISVIGAAK